MKAWGFFVLDPQRDGARLALIAELAGAAQSDASAAKLLAAIGKAEPAPQVSQVRKVA